MTTERSRNIRAINVSPGDYVLSIDGLGEVRGKVADTHVTTHPDGERSVRIEFTGRESHYAGVPAGTWVRIQVQMPVYSDGVTSSKAYARARAAAGIR